VTPVKEGGDVVEEALDGVGRLLEDQSRLSRSWWWAMGLDTRQRDGRAFPDSSYSQWSKRSGVDGKCRKVNLVRNQNTSFSSPNDRALC
jgi:hypothetical protein